MKLAAPGMSAFVAMLAVIGGAGRLQAQASLPQDASWTLEGSQGGYCISYLADPAIARKMVPGSTMLTPAGNGAGLPPLLASTIREEPRFAQWIPGMLCFGFYQRVSEGSRTIAQGRPGKPVIVVTTSLAAQNAHGAEGATEYLVDFLTDNRNLTSAADRIGVDMANVEYASRLRVEGGDPSVTINIDGTVISWSGHTLADSSVGKTRSVSFGYGGPKSAAWLMKVDLAPASSKLIVGNISVSGSNNLAKALRASPGRSIGPLESGGSVSIMFHAVTRK